MIHNILFDIGVVLLHIDYGRALRVARKFCDPARADYLNRFFNLDERDPVIVDYERGHVSTEEFYTHFVEQTGFSGTYDVFITTWRSLLSENQPMLAFARELSAHHNIFLATNIGPIHMPAIFDDFPPLRMFKDTAASCDLEAVKPERAFYEKALHKFGVTPADCLFIDDRPENVRGAEACGIRSLPYTTPEQTIPAVRAALLT